MALIIIQKYKLIFLRAVINELDLKKKKKEKKNAVANDTTP